MTPRPCAIRRIRSLGWLLPLLLLLAPAAEAGDVETYQRLLQTTADELSFGMEVERSVQPDGGFDLKVWKSAPGNTGVMMECTAYGSVKAKRALLLLATKMMEAQKGVHKGGRPPVKTGVATVEGMRVKTTDVPQWTYKTPTMNSTMPRVRTMTVEITELIALKVTSYNTRAPGPTMRKLLENFKAMGLSGTPPEKDAEPKEPEPDQPPKEPAPPDDAGSLVVRIAASAPGYAGAVERLTQDAFLPGTVTVRGVVRDLEGAPVPDASVVIMGHPVRTTTDASGRYQLSFSGGGEKPWARTLDLVMARKLEAFACRLESARPLVANGRPQRVVLRLTSAAGAVKNRKVRLDLPPGWKRRGRDVPFIGHTAQASRLREVASDAQGRIEFDFPAPGLMPDRPKVFRDQEQRAWFPAEGELVVRDLETGQTCRTRYRLVSPYPNIATFRMIDVTSRNWQPKPGSLLEIDDPDSTTFDVEIRVAGKLRIPREPRIYTRTMYLPQREGHRLQFFYQPPDWGKRLDKQPGSLWKEFGMFNLELAGKIALDKAGGAFLEQTSAAAGLKDAKRLVQANADVPDAVLQAFAQRRAEDAKELLGKASKLWNVVGTKDKIEQQIEAQKRVKKKASTASQVIEGWDTLAGIVELKDSWHGKQVTQKIGEKLLTSGKLGKLAAWASQSNVPLDVLKVTYENAKFLLKLHEQFEAVANAQQDTMLVPVVVKVTDADGLQTVALRSVTVWIWKEARK